MVTINGSTKFHDDLSPIHWGIISMGQSGGPAGPSRRHVWLEWAIKRSDQLKSQSGKLLAHFLEALRAINYTHKTLLVSEEHTLPSTYACTELFPWLLSWLQCQAETRTHIHNTAHWPFFTSHTRFKSSTYAIKFTTQSPTLSDTMFKSFIVSGNKGI